MVGGPSAVFFSFEDNQRIRRALLIFKDDQEAVAGDAMATLRVLRPDEIVGDRSGPRDGDVLATFRNWKLASFTVFVPLAGKLHFVETPLSPVPTV